MKKILFFSVDILPFSGLGTSGGGMRAWSLYEGLKSSGFDVRLSIPRFQYLSKKYWDHISDDLKSSSWDWGGQEKIIRETDPDIVVYSSNWGIVDITKELDIPIVIDLDGPVLLENYYSKKSLSRADFSIKTKKLSLGDFFIFVNRRQHEYFNSWLLMSGVILDRKQCGTIPVSCSPKMPDISCKNKPTIDRVKFFYGGGFFPWHNPSNSINILAKILEETKKGELSLFIDSHGISSSEKKYNSFRDELENNPSVKIRGLVPRNDLLNEYHNADVAWDLMSWNLERELAFTTRTMDYLWAGLPVVYNNYSELSEYIRKYKAGWCVDPGNPEGIKIVIEEILNAPKQLEEYSINAQKLVKENFTWDKTITPLVDFCKNPQKRERCSDLNSDMLEALSEGKVRNNNASNRAIQCYKENGMKYTLKKAIEYLKLG